MIGFSLGAETVKHLILTLNECGAHHVIHEVLFIGGLTSFDTPNGEPNIYNKNIFGSTISGSISNFYSKNDTMSTFFNKISNETIGCFEKFKI